MGEEIGEVTKSKGDTVATKKVLAMKDRTESSITPIQQDLINSLQELLKKLTKQNVQVDVYQNELTMYHCGQDKTPLDALRNTFMKVK